jgi:glycosyltransferase involved in cell wall biosynthesis
MVTPSARGGHPRYTWELMNALRDEAPESELKLTLVTSTDLDVEFRTTRYEIADVLPRLRDRSTFRSALEWAVSRVGHYARREEAILRWARRQDRLDILHYQEPPFAAALHFARVRRLGCHAVATVHNLRPHRYVVPATGWLSDSSARHGWRNCSTVFVHSAVLRETLSAELGPHGPPIVAIPHGVWTGHGARTAEGRPGGYLLLFGVMRRNKGVHLMLDALKQLPGNRLVLAGAFEERSLASEVRSRIASENLDVTLLDRIIPENEIASLFEGASLVVLPYTHFHAQSGVLHLAIGYGVPSVVTNVGALGEQVERERIGAVAVEGGPAAFAQAVRQALEPKFHDEARRRCLALASNQSWSVAARHNNK